MSLPVTAEMTQTIGDEPFSGYQKYRKAPHNGAEVIIDDPLERVEPVLIIFLPVCLLGRR